MCKRPLAAAARILWLKIWKQNLRHFLRFAHVNHRLCISPQFWGLSIEVTHKSTHHQICFFTGIYHLVLNFFIHIFWSYFRVFLWKLTLLWNCDYKMRRFTQKTDSEFDIMFEWVLFILCTELQFSSIHCYLLLFVTTDLTKKSKCTKVLKRFFKSTVPTLKYPFLTLHH